MAMAVDAAPYMPSIPDSYLNISEHQPELRSSQHAKKKRPVSGSTLPVRAWQTWHHQLTN